MRYIYKKDIYNRDMYYVYNIYLIYLQIMTGDSITINLEMIKLAI